MRKFVLLPVVLFLPFLLACTDDDANPESFACPGIYETQRATQGLNTGFLQDGEQREFYLGIPAETQSPMPLFVAFNGTGGSGADFFNVSAELQGFVDKGFLVVAPSSAGHGFVWPVWDGMRSAENYDVPNPDLAFFDSLLTCIRDQYDVDADRIYIGGHSAGGIFTNYVLKARSSILAGGIPASGMIDGTDPSDNVGSLDNMIVIVTSGGETDSWGGDADRGDTSVTEVNFYSQASLATHYYYEQPNITMVSASMDLGHKWLAPLNGWMADVLLLHPKTRDGEEPFSLPPLPETVAASVSLAPFDLEASFVIECVEGTIADCAALCQFIGDCAVANDLLVGVLKNNLADYGYSAEDYSDCGDCVANCDEIGAGDAEVLACFDAAFNEATCSVGLAGAQPLIGAINDCCLNETGSPVCQMLCGSLNSNSVAKSFFPSCAAYE